MKLALQIALGIILATVILSAAGWATMAGVAWWGAKQIEAAAAEARDRQAERERQAAEARRLQAEYERLAAVREQQVREVRQAREREQSRLEKAFEDQYESPPGCANPQSNRRWVECVDLKRAAKAEFMGQYAPMATP